MNAISETAHSNKFLEAFLVKSPKNNKFNYLNATFPTYALDAGKPSDLIYVNGVS